MQSDLYIPFLGAAAVIDTVLLLAVLERRNRGRVLAPVLVLVLGGWLWHAGSFVYALLGGVDEAWAAGLTWAAMVVMSAGLLLMPSAMLHGIWRIRRSGLVVQPSPDPRYVWAYTPVLALVPVAWYLWRQTEPGLYVDHVRPLVPAYGAWLTAVNVATAIGFVRLRNSEPTPRPRQFFGWMAVTLGSLVVFHAFTFLLAIPAWPAHRPGWLLVVMLSPVLPALVFAYYVVRYDFMQVMVERTLVYAAILIGCLLVHESAVRPVTAQLSGRFGMNFAVVEALLVVGLIAAYQPLRQRVAEALRYLMGVRVAPMRDRTRRLAVRMSGYAAHAPDELLRWFVPALRDALRVRFASVVLFDASGDVAAREDGADRAAGGAAAASAAFPSGVEARLLRDDLITRGAVSAGLRDAPDPAVLDRLRGSGASLAVLLRHQRIDGVLLVGQPAGGRDLGEEESNAAVMLAEHLAVTLGVGLLHADRLAAERRALQGEKLATLGLVAGSIAHEVKNPLSSIKTIATVLAEELGPDDPRAEGVRLIREEVDRLSSTVTRLLRFARPAARHDPARPVSVADVLAGTLHVMGYVARERGVAVQCDIDDALPEVPGDEDALREIFTNLVANAIEATAGTSAPGPDGRRANHHPAGQVRVRATSGAGGRRVIVEVEDDGPGVPESVRRRLFEPFVTGDDKGTGLGLYVVGRRVRELGGDVRWDGEPARRGTRFVVELPGVPAPDADRRAIQLAPTPVDSGTTPRVPLPAPSRTT